MRKPAKPRRKPPAASQPVFDPAATQPSAQETLSDALRRFGRFRPQDWSEPFIAQRTAYDFVVALGEADGERAARLIDAVGYQALPAGVSLPETGDRPLASPDVKTLVNGLSHRNLAALPTDAVRLLKRAELQALFPAVAEWALPDDIGVVVRLDGSPWPARAPTHPAPNVQSPGDPTAQTTAPPGDESNRLACFLIRMRGDRPTILGGTILAALKP